MSILKESSSPYIAVFEIKKGILSSKNTYYLQTIV